MKSKIQKLKSSNTDSSSLRAIETVQNYIEAIDEMGDWYGYSFEELSYSRWSADELLQCLQKERFTPPLAIMEDFRDKMDQYSQVNEKNSFMFLVARDVTDAIIESLLS